MGKYHQLTEAQRYQIYALKKVGPDQQTIARVLGVSPSTVSREIRRIGDWEIDLVMGAKHRGDWSR